jgi:multidrug efflux pump
MRLAAVSIARPVLATVMNLFIVVAGAAAFFALPVREYPDVDPPVVSVSTILVGASAETVETSVTEPLEQVLNGIEGIRSIESSSTFGRSSINIEFTPDRDLDVAGNDVSNAIQRALFELPIDAERPVVLKAGADDQPIMWLHIDAEGYTPEERSDLADRLVRTPLQIVPGVSRAILGGSRRYAMRVWLDPVQMAARGVDAVDVRRTIRENNLAASAGALEASARKFTIHVEGQLDDPADYEQLVIRDDGDGMVRLGDVGRVELGAEAYDVTTRFSRSATTGVGIVRQSRSNQLEVSRGVTERLPELSRALPAGASVGVAVDNTLFVEASLEEVWITLVIALVLVFIVSLVFLRSLTSTLITAAAIPVSVVGTFAVMEPLGFSINVLTLLALVLAIGLLVDDSIVVMENIYRRRELGESALRAANNGSREVGFAVIATTAAVVAVLVPLAFMTGNIGRLFREFAVTMTISIAISMFVALTLVPMLCSRFLVPASEVRGLARVLESALFWMARGYERVLDLALTRRAAVGAFLLLTGAASAVLFAVLPQTLVPVEDRGSFVTIIRAPRGSTPAYTNRAIEQVEARLEKIPEVEGFFAAVALGGNDSSQGIVFTRLEEWRDRDRSQQSIVGELFRDFSQIPEALVFPVNPQSLGQRNAADLHLVLSSPSATLAEFEQVTRSILDDLAGVQGLVNVDTDLSLDNPQLNIRFDRERAADVGVPVSAVAETVRLLVSQSETSDFVMRNKQYDVVMALSPRYRSEPEQLGNVHVRARDGTMIPLASLVEIDPVIGPSALNHHGLQRSATLTGNLAPGASLGEVLPRVDQILDARLPSGFTRSYSGLSREFVESSGAVLATFGVALLVIYLVLAAQFESFVHPVTVMLSVPLACAGALATLYLFGHTLNLYSQIGIVLLVGLVTKNAILLVDFANQDRARGATLATALRAAGQTRFRPILMTSVTSILGAVPLAIAVGAGAESRREIGAAVVGGLLFSTFFTLVVIPVLHGVVIQVAEWAGFSTIPPKIELELEHELADMSAAGTSA